MYNWCTEYTIIMILPQKSKRFCDYRAYFSSGITGTGRTTLGFKFGVLSAQQLEDGNFRQDANAAGIAQKAIAYVHI